MISGKIKRFLVAIVFLVFYFVIFTNFIPMIRSFIYSFVDANNNLFKLDIATTEYSVNETGNITVTTVYKTIDFTIFMKFLFEFTIAFIIPFGVLFIMFRR